MLGEAVQSKSKSAIESSFLFKIIAVNIESCNIPEVTSNIGWQQCKIFRKKQKTSIFTFQLYLEISR